MEIAKIRIVGAKAYVLFQRRIPAGLVGGYISVEYSGPEWDGLSKTAVFRGAVTRDVINAGETVVIPHEAVKAPGIVLEVGFYGSNTDGTVVIPTFWVNLGVVGPAADPSGDESADPELPVWAQILAMIGDMAELKTESKDNLVSAINEMLVNLSMKLEDGVSEIQPDTYYVFGEVSKIAVTLAEADDGKAHEYCFEFVAADDFDGFSITPAPRWTGPVQVVPGKTHQVSILRGIGVMICA